MSFADGATGYLEGEVNGEGIEISEDRQRRQPVRRKYEDAFQKGGGDTEKVTEEEDDIDSLEEHIIPQPTTHYDNNGTENAASNNSDGVALLDRAEPEAASIVKVIPCGVHTCFQTFTSLQEYSNHYNRRHMYVCATCKKSLPTSHLLELHVLELHDTYFAMSALKKPMYLCLLETCKEKFSDVQTRKSHCLEDHKFPEKFQYWEFRKPEKKSGKSNYKSKRKVDEQLKKGNKQVIDPSTSAGSQGHSINNHKADPKIDPCSARMSPEEVIMAEEDDENATGKENSSTSHIIDVAEDHESRKDSSSTFVPSSVAARTKHLTFGRSAPRVFKNNYSFGLPKNRTATVTTSNNNQSNNSVSPSEDQMDFTEVQKALVKLL